MALRNEEIISYLANIIAVARADGALSPRESNILENIQKSIGAKKTDLKKAFTLAESPGFKPVPVGRFVDKVQNLEDLIHVSIVDGRTEQPENSIISDFTKQIGLSQEQVNTLFEEVKTVLSAEAKIIPCPKCGQQINNAVKFCPQCGVPIAEAEEKETVKVSYRIPTSGIAIEFAESTTSGFSESVKIAKTALLNETCIKDNKTWYLAVWPSSDILQVVKLAESLKGVRNRKVYVEGVETRWDEVFGCTWCVEQRNSAYRPIEYCFGLDEKRINIWGCKQARMDWEEWAGWFSYGYFKEARGLRNEATFVFDKERIRHELQTNIYKFRFCPYLNLRLIQAVIEAFPGEVTATEKGLWTFKRDSQETPGSIHVKTNIQENGYTLTDDFFSSGVVPKSCMLGLEILKKAAGSCGVNPTELKDILEYKG